MIHLHGCHHCHCPTTVSDEQGRCPSCVTKAAQIAAIRQRLGDIAAGANGFGIYNGPNTKMAISWAIMELFKVPVDYTKCGDLDSLAAWLWERGVRG